MIVYHGSSQIVEHPDVLHSYRALDFGKGFYVTSIREQAVHWAKRKADIAGSSHAVLNQYHLNETMDGLRVKTFPEDMNEWIDFVCNCRDGKEVYLEYDIIIGKVANDKVFRVVDMYHSGIWDRARALQEIKVYPHYDQIMFVTQASIDQLLRFEGYEEI